MHKIEFESSGRSMRWYEWLLGLCLFAAAAGVRAEAAVYKCVDAQGAVAYQQVACGAQQRQGMIEIASAPRYAPSPHYAVERRVESLARAPRSKRERVSEEMAYECRASDGRVFYRLGACPHSIGGDADSTPTKSSRGKKTASGSVHVAARRIPRDAACHEIHRAGAIGRDGHEFDEHISTYERDLGHDPCK